MQLGHEFCHSQCYLFNFVNFDCWRGIEAGNGLVPSILEQSGWSENDSLLGTCC